MGRADQPVVVEKEERPLLDEKAGYHVVSRDLWSEEREIVVRWKCGVICG